MSTFKVALLLLSRPLLALVKAAATYLHSICVYCFWCLLKQLFLVFVKAACLHLTLLTCVCYFWRAVDGRRSGGKSEKVLDITCS